MRNWRRGKIRDICLGVDVESSKIFEQDDDVRKMVHLEDAEFYGKWDPTTYLDWIMSMKDSLIGALWPTIEKFIYWVKLWWLCSR